MTITKRVQKELVQAVPPVDTQLLQTLRKSSTLKLCEIKARSAAERNKGKAWTREEHERFLVALEKFPSGPWKAIAGFVGTKDSRQTMTHAQKYRQKHERQQRGLRTRNKTKSVTQRTLAADATAESQPQGDVAMVEVTDFSVFEAPPTLTLAKQQSDSPRSVDGALNSDPFAPAVADESLFSLALDAGATWLSGKSDSDLVEIFTEYNEPVTDAAWPQMWSTNSLEEMMVSCSQFDFLGEN
ncbi:Myb-like DNA-binding domain [Phytophthora infestans]|uniref:Myb-like DNA-binding domain n=1 Tax=Phytophthora infestans TaxID=4787 RepID=A0A833SG10_PHYIN|nr:Myb-like DNA-binding domain [Phytophthora infestans]KAF4143062.1 Myb-like DNA-binding domain [Phytophthora infestans]